MNTFDPDINGFSEKNFCDAVAIYKIRPDWYGESNIKTDRLLAEAGGFQEKM